MNEIEKINKRVSNYETKEIIIKHKSEDFKNKKILTFGTFDLFHIGHKKIIDHALDIAVNERNLIIAVSSDSWNKLKGKESIENEQTRIDNLKRIYPNSNVILEDHKTPIKK